MATIRRTPLLVAISLALLAFAQGLAARTTGSIRGKVTDADGQPLAGATVTVTGEALLAGRRLAESGSSGAFRFHALPVGVYAVKAELEGYQGRVTEGVDVDNNGTVSLRLRLLSTFSDDVVVSAEPPLVDVTSSSLRSSYKADFVEELPLPRYFWDMMLVSPGVTANFEDSFGAAIAFGSGVQSHDWQIDGASVKSPFLGSAWWYLNPDTIEEVQVLGVGAPAEYGNLLGAAFNVVTKSGGNDFAGTINTYFQDDSWTDANVTLDDSPFPEFHRGEFRDVTGSLGGPLWEDRAWFFAAAQSQRDAKSHPGTDPAFEPTLKSDRYDLKLDFQLGSGSTLQVSAHLEDWVEPEPGSPAVTPDAQAILRGSNPAWSAQVTSILSDRSVVEAKYAGWTGDLTRESLTGSTEPALIDFTPPGGGPPMTSGGIIGRVDADHGRQELDATFSHLAEARLGDQDFKVGLQVGLGEAERTIALGPAGAFFTTTANPDGSSLDFMNFTAPSTDGADTRSVALFADDSWHLSDRLTLNLGLRFDYHDADIPSFERFGADGLPTGERAPGLSSAVEWTLLSPRLGFAYQPDGRTVVRGAAGLYYDGVVSGNWTSPPPGAPPFRRFTRNPETGAFDVLVFERPTRSTNIDPDLEAPRTLQLSLGFERQLGAELAFGAQLVYKDTQDLVGWEILDDGVYEEVPWVNPVTGEAETLLGIVEAPTVRKGNRAGFTVLGPDTEYEQEYEGLVLTFDKRYSGGWSLRSSYTWSRSQGLIPHFFSNFQNNILLTTTEGSDPNHFLNADQLLQGDREHMLRVQAAFDLPWGLAASTSVNFQTGRPYSRQLNVPLAQGNTRVTAVPGSDDQRYPSQSVIDVALGKRIRLGGDVTLEIDAQLFNVLNDDAVDRWASLIVGPDHEFVGRTYLQPRRLMLHFGLEF